MFIFYFICTRVNLNIILKDSLFLFALFNLIRIPIPIVVFSRGEIDSLLFCSIVFLRIEKSQSARVPLGLVLISYGRHKNPCVCVCAEGRINPTEWILSLNFWLPHRYSQQRSSENVKRISKRLHH
jgi:hypothetical protein